jgi:hypothetical protein
MWFEGEWMQMEDVLLSEVSQAQKDKATCFLLMWETGTMQILEIL